MSGETERPGESHEDGDRGTAWIQSDVKGRLTAGGGAKMKAILNGGEPAEADALDRDPVIFDRQLFSDDLIRDLGGDPEAQGLGAATGIGPAKTLLIAVTEYLDEYHPYWRVSPGAVPDGLRLEMHPRVHYTLAEDPDTYHWPREQGDSFEELYRRTFRLPVKITPDLPEGTWRLVVVTEDVKLGGKLP